MDVISKQPTTTGSNQDLPMPSEQLHAGILPPGYDGAYGSAQEPSITQPMLWMPIPTDVPLSCIAGLEYLTAVDQMFVDQQVELVEAIANIECANKYKFVNSLNQQVYFVTEESDFCERMCFKNGRSFKMRIWDNYGREVMRVIRPLQCCAGCCWCADKASCSLYVEVEAPVGQVIGRVKQTKSLWTAQYDITSQYDDVLLKIRGPKCILDGPCCTKDQDFIIYTPDLNEEIGKISKTYSGFFRELFTKSDKFAIFFPLDLDVKAKATIFGALFLIDFMFFERHK